MNKVSIVIPNYNGSIWLKECLNSAVSQDYNSYDIIVIDDCSTDLSIEIIKKYQKEHKNITLLQHAENKGVSQSRNTGVRFSKSEYIAFLDSDDTVSKKWLSTTIEEINKKTLDVCGCWLNAATSSSWPITYKVSNTYSKITNELWFVGGNIGGLIVKKGLCLKFPFNTTMSIYEDRLFYTQLLNETKKISNIQEKLYFYRRHVSNATKKTTDTELSYSRIQNITKKYRKLGTHAVTLGAPVTIKNILISIYLGLATLTIKNYFLYVTLLSYYSWKDFTR